MKQGQQLLQNTPTLRGNITMDRELLQEAIKTKSNRKVFGVKAYLMAWNLGMYLATEKDQFWRKYYRWFDKDERYLKGLAWSLVKVIGEPPVLIDTIQLKLDADNLKNYLQSHGYLDAQVHYSVEQIFSKIKLINGIERLMLDPKLANVSFIVDEQSPYLIKNVEVICEDTAIYRLVKGDTSQSYLRTGQLYRESDFEMERIRIANLLRNHGYFRFSPGLIQYVVDTTGQSLKRKVYTLMQRGSVVALPSPPLYADVQVLIEGSGQKPYRIEELNVFLKKNSTTTSEEQIILKGFDLSDEIRRSMGLRKSFLSEKNDAVFHVPLSHPKLFHYNFLRGHILLAKDSLYKVKDLLLTQQRLQNLGIFRSFFVDFEANDSLHTLKPNVQLELVSQNSFQVGFEAFQSENRNLNANLPGIGGRMTYIHRNIFKKADKLEITGTGSLNFYYPDSTADLRTFFQLIPKASLVFPRIVGLSRLFKYPYDIKPTTRITLSYLQENRIEFRRSILGFQANYEWYSRNSNHYRYIFTLWDVNVVNSRDLSQGFLAQIAQLPPTTAQLILRDFTPRVNSKFGFKLFYNDYQKGQSYVGRSHIFSAELGGFVPFALEQISFQNKRDTSLTDGSLNNRYLYGQFYKLYQDSRLYVPVFKGSVLVVRAFGGLALGFNRTKIVPFENRFFMGGISSVRGWQSNTLGPGTFVKSENNLLVYGGEIAFEANVEWRQKIYKYLEMALFTDVGNVWFSKSGGFEASEGKFSVQNLKLGMASGIGVRLDFTFLVIRLDIAHQLYDPSAKSWVIKDISTIGARKVQYNLGIGYPF